MKPLPAFGIVVFFAAIPCAATRAGDTTDVLVAADKATNEAPACRVITITTSVGYTWQDKQTVEAVKPHCLHVKAEKDGMTYFESITDGKRTFMSRDGAKLTELSAQRCAEMKHANDWLAGKAETRRARHVTMVGHEEVNGVSATIYAFDTADVGGLHSVFKDWISDQDHRLLKVENEVTRVKSPGVPQEKAIDMKSSSVFEYDPSIKVTLPDS